MDKALYVGVGAENETMRKLAVITNNLANSNTTGFQADQLFTESYKALETQNSSRTYTHPAASYASFKHGPTYETGRDLDVAIKGNGFFTVQTKDGREGLTRAGDFELSPLGVLQTRNGEMVLGESGPVLIPTDVLKMSIGSDGTVSILQPNQIDMTILGKLKLVNPPSTDIAKGADGKFYVNNDGTALIDKNVQLSSGHLEGSNVNTVEAMTQLIEVSRHFEFQTTMAKTLGENATKANELLNLQR